MLAALLACALLVTAGGERARAQKRVPRQPASVPSTPGYLDPRLPLEVRVDDLVSRMTIEEEASQMINNARAIPRLGIPAYHWWSEGLHGVGYAGRATVFPQAIGLAASWDADLVHRVAVAVSTEARAKFEWDQLSGGTRDHHGLTFWSPNVNIFRDPRWGRGQETYGEDPFLTARLAVAFVTGMQGNNSRYLRTIATPKHFAVHSGPELLRHVFDAEVSAQDLESTYLPAFRAAITTGHAGSVMCAYSAVDGVPACASKLLLGTHLRDAWKFSGYVVSDCGAIDDIWENHHYAPDRVHAVALAVAAGTDLSCGDEFLDVPAAVYAGLLPEADVDRAVKRLFRARFRLGLFDPPAMVPYARTPLSEISSAAHRRLALEAARETMVLLRNENQTLPLSPAVRTIAIVGPEADLLAPLLGNYHGTPENPVTPLAGMIRRFGNRSRLLYAQGSKLVRALPVPIPAGVLVPASGDAVPKSVGGLTGQYFDNPDFRGTPSFKRTDLSVDFDWDGVNPGPGLKKDNFSVRWTGNFIPPAPGTYELGVHVPGCYPCRHGPADEFRLYLDGKLISQRSVTPDLMMPVHFADTASHALRLEYAHRHSGEDAGIELLWNPPAEALRDQAIAAARRANVVVVFLGITPELESEENAGLNLPGFRGGDRTRLSLPAPQEKLLEALAAAGKPIVVVLMNGGALAVDWARTHAAAILEAWYPGEEGGTAIAETLAGENNPSGRLPVTFYKSVAELPPFDEYPMKGRTYRYFTGQSLYPFGFGLSYSRFVYGNLRLSSKNLSAGSPLNVRADVRNASARAGDEVVELYLSFPPFPGAPIRALCGFRRVHFKAGEEKTVAFHLNPRALSHIDAAGERLISAGVYRLSVGGGQPASGLPTLETSFAIHGSDSLPR